MLNLFKSRSLLYKLFASYFIIFVIPLAIMASMLYKTSVIDLIKEIENSNLHKLTQLKDTLDIRMQELEYIALKISLDPYLTPTRMSRNEYNMMEGIDKIGIYKANNAFINELYVYYRNLDSIFSQYGVISTGVFAERIHAVRNEKTENETLYYDIRTIDAPTIGNMKAAYIQMGNNDVVTYYYPVSYINGKPEVVVAFTIKRPVFDKMIQDFLGELPGNVFVLDRDKNLIVSAASDDNEYFRGVPAMLEERGSPGIYSIRDGNKELSLIKVDSDYNGWNYAVTLETSRLFEKAVYMRTLILQIALSLLAFGVFIMILFARTNYKPINRLSRYVGLQWPQSDKPGRMNEIDRIMEAVTTAVEQNKDLKDQIDFQLPLLEEQVLTKLLKGEINNEKLMLRVIDSLHIKLAGPYYVVLVIGRYHTGDSAISGKYKNEVLSFISGHYGKEGIMYPVELLHTDDIALIVNMEESNCTRENMGRFIKKIMQAVEQRSSREIIIGVGKICENITQINRSFVEAMAAIENNPARRSSKILYFEDITVLKQQQWYPAESQLCFIQGLKQGDLSVAMEALQNMTGHMAEKKEAFRMLDDICFDTINLIIKALSEINIHEFDEDVEKIKEFTSLGDFGKRLEILAFKICNYIEEGKRMSSNRFYNQIVEYINSEFDDAGLSLEAISDKFNISVYYLSRVFKEKMGLNYTEYITKLRMEKARELLKNTDITLKALVTSLGYTDLPCFMRKFKKIEGITPGEYRRIHSKKDQDKKSKPQQSGPISKESKPQQK